MLSIKVFGDKQDAKFVWSIAVLDSRGNYAFTDGVDDSELDAKASMLAKLTTLVEKLEFRPVDEGAEVPVDEEAEVS
jgi:hypothetical protein